MKLTIMDVVTLKDGTKGKVVEFDIKSSSGYTIQLGINGLGGGYRREWIRQADIAAVNGKCIACGGSGQLPQLDAQGESVEHIECPQCHPAYSNNK